jgi:hypothetical protein
VPVKVWTAAELEEMTPTEQDEAFASAVVSDLDAVPANFLTRVRNRVQERIDAPRPTPGP